MSDSKFTVVGDWLAYDTGKCNCGCGFDHYGHEPGCSLEPVVKIEELSEVLAAAGYSLRSPEEQP